jgi:hypothetical protein
MCFDATKSKVVQLSEAKIVALFGLNDIFQQSLLQPQTVLLHIRRITAWKYLQFLTLSYAPL